MSLLVVCQGIQGALLHGNGDVGERSIGGPQRRNGAVAVGSVQRNGGNRTSKYLKAARTRRGTRRLTLRLCSKVLSRKGDCGSGNDGERWTAEDVQVPGFRCHFNLGWGWPVGSPIVTSRGLSARPKGGSALVAA
jgi:hypothetical protein